jgi:mannose-1-phosphate guanylyltransferase
VPLYNTEITKKSSLSLGSQQSSQLDLELSMAIPSISVDYAVMERGKKIKSGFV